MYLNLYLIFQGEEFNTIFNIFFFWMFFECTEETASGQKKKKARRSGSGTLNFIGEKLETDTKMKQKKLTQRRSEKQKIADQQNNILQKMQLEQVNQRLQMQDVSSFCVKLAAKAIYEGNCGKFANNSTG